MLTEPCVWLKQVTIMFVILEKIAQVEPKYVDIVLLENYAAFQHRFNSFSLMVLFHWLHLYNSLLLFYITSFAALLYDANMSYIHTFYWNYTE